MTRSTLTPVTVKVRYSSVASFLTGERGRVSAMGILLRGGKGHVAIGERVLIRVELENGMRAIVAEGVARTLPPQLDGEEGQWIQFRRFDSATKAMMKQALASGVLLKHPAPRRTPSTRVASPATSVPPVARRFSGIPTAFTAPSVAPAAPVASPRVESRDPASVATLETDDSGVRSRPGSSGKFVPPTPEKRESLLEKLRRRATEHTEVSEVSNDSRVKNVRPTDDAPLARQA